MVEELFGSCLVKGFVAALVKYCKVVFLEAFLQP